MKKLFVLAALALPLMWTACSDKPATPEEVIPKGMVAVDLTKLGHPVKINLPDSTNGVLDSLETPGGIQLRIGNNFDLLVNTAGTEEADIAKQKSLIEAQDAGASTFTVNDATTLVWETKFGELSMFHFYTVIKIGGDTYYVRDNNTNAENMFKKEDVDRMLESAKSLRAMAQPEAAPAS
ncbi:MAG TPA: hypothetical protein VK826_00520 [Bacteroidia bacterium]|nr:hypothetical protein [Bacteroidia bacterium]